MLFVCLLALFLIICVFSYANYIIFDLLSAMNERVLLIDRKGCFCHYRRSLSPIYINVRILGVQLTCQSKIN